MTACVPFHARILLAGVVVISLVAGCAGKITRTLVSPEGMNTLDARSPFLKAHMSNGTVYVLGGWQVDSTSTAIRGNGVLLDANRIQVDSGDFRLASDSVVLFETNVEESSGAKTAITVMAGITAVVAGMCAADPKTCFGSCPTFYAPGPEGRMELQAEGFSSSVAPALEATDVDMLLHTQPTERDFTIRLTNEAFETHVIRHADLLAVPKKAGGRVYVTSDGRYREASAPVAPSRCTAMEGDCLPRLLVADGEERFSSADSSDLATRETIDLEFTRVPDGDLGLVLVSRQTFITTFLIYQALAYMGSEAGRFLATLETGGDEARERAGAIGRVLGDIEVLVQEADGAWVVVGSVGETGPIASDTRVVPLPAGQLGSGRVRLRLTQGMWRLDQVVLVQLGDEVTPRRIMPQGVRKGEADDEAALRALRDREEALVTLPGDAYEVTYHLPAGPAGYEFFLEARGYYLEWMRQEWMADEDPLRAAQVLMDPAGAMRDLAPMFKARESSFERLFWGSRYVR
jgi:hypothetical protein